MHKKINPFEQIPGYRDNPAILDQVILDSTIKSDENQDEICIDDDDKDVLTIGQFDDDKKNDVDYEFCKSPPIDLRTMHQDTYSLVLTHYDKYFTNKQPPKILVSAKRFRDPVLVDITVEYEFIAQLIDTPEMQRLRNIKQLSNNLVFLGATHNRFNHSLGVYHLASTVHNNITKSFLMRNSEKYNELKREIATYKESAFFISRYGQCLLLASALLHDIGHGPYSHSFEKILQLNPQKKAIDHETIGALGIITNPRSNIYKILNSVGPRFAEDVADIIKKTSRHTPIVQVISSDLDVDRLDYLSRDSYFCGVSYGKTEVSRIVSSLKLRFGHICYRSGESGGISERETLTHYLQARDRMYQIVYHHKISCSFEKLLIQIFRRLFVVESQFKLKEKESKDSADRDGMIIGAEQTLDKTDEIIHLLSRPLMNVILNSTSVDDFVDNAYCDYIKINDSYIDTLIHLSVKHSDTLLASLAKRVVERKLFKTILLDFPNVMDVKQKKSAHKKIIEFVKRCLMNVIAKNQNAILERLGLEADSKIDFYDIASYFVAEDALKISGDGQNTSLENSQNFSQSPGIKNIKKDIYITKMYYTPCERSQNQQQQLKITDPISCFNTTELDDVCQFDGLNSQPCDVSVFETDEEEINKDVKFVYNERHENKQEINMHFSEVGQFLADTKLTKSILLVTKKGFDGEIIREFTPTVKLMDVEEYRIYLPISDDFIGMTDDDFRRIASQAKELASSKDFTLENKLTF